MKRYFLNILIVLCALVGTTNKANAETITKTYLFSGETAGSQTTFQGYFYEEGIPNAHYTCFPNPWTYGSTDYIHATLKDGITINIASSNSQIFVQNKGTLGVAGDVTVTVGGGTQHNYYIWHVTLYSSAAQPAIDEYNWGADVESTHTFSKTINPGYFYKLVVTYSEQDIYLINESSTIISGVDDEYIYTGSDIWLEPVVVCNGRTLTKGTHYTTVYTLNNKPGTATLKVDGISPYHGRVTKDYEIIDPATVPLEWTAGSTVEVTEDYTSPNPISVTGIGNVTLRIANGVTLTAQYGITIADNATLTVEGQGTLTVTNYTSIAIAENGCEGGMGRAGVSGSLIVNGGTVSISGGLGGEGGGGVIGDLGSGGAISHGGYGGKGGQGGAGVSGSLTVNGGTVNVHGGEGGQGGNGGFGSVSFPGDGGKGGVGISGLLTVTGGTVNVSGGIGGWGGKGSGNGKHGSIGDAMDGTVICTVSTHVIQERDRDGNWSNLASGSTSWKRFVRVIPLTPLTLYDNADNTAAIQEAAADGNPFTVTLSGRTLYRDGAWNTLCLPFDMSASQVSSILAPAALMTLSTSDFNGGTLTLTFADATTIEAGKPYIIKWNATGTHLTESDLVFPCVTVKSGTTDTETDYVDFIGTYDQTSIYANPAVNLYLGDGSKLYWPDTAGYEIGPCRAYFHLKGLTAGNITNGARLFFNGGDASGITTMSDVRCKMSDVWYDLSGRKLSGQPTKPGLYINKGKKINR